MGDHSPRRPRCGVGVATGKLATAHDSDEFTWEQLYCGVELPWDTNESPASLSSRPDEYPYPSAPPPPPPPAVAAGQVQTRPIPEESSCDFVTRHILGTVVRRPSDALEQEGSEAEVRFQRTAGSWSFERAKQECGGEQRAMAQSLVEYVRAQRSQGSWVLLSQLELDFLSDSVEKLAGRHSSDRSRSRSRSVKPSVAHRLPPMNGAASAEEMCAAGKRKRPTAGAAKITVQPMTLEACAQAAGVPPALVSRTESRLANLSTWDFDLFELQGLTTQPLKLVGLAVASKADVCSALQTEQAVLAELLDALDASYNAVPYHNAWHAADVVHATFVFTSRVQDQLIPARSRAALLIAAAAHDVGHPGVNNQFLTVTRHDLAVRYNDSSVLENYHAANLFELTKSVNRDVFAGLTSEQFTSMRKLVVRAILMTDMSQHKANLEAFAHQVEQGVAPESAGDQISFLGLLMHAADVSNPARPWAVYMKWLPLISEEFYQQGDRERQYGLPVLPFNDRNDPPPVDKFQGGFINHVILPLFQSIDRPNYVNLSEITGHLRHNGDRWAKWDSTRDTTEA